jgi:hypothetical protein
VRGSVHGDLRGRDVPLAVGQNPAANPRLTMGHPPHPLGSPAGMSFLQICAAWMNCVEF